MRKILLTLSLTLPLLAAGQYQQNSDIFPSFGNYERKGWLISPALTYTLKPFKENQERVFTGSDSVYDVLITAKGKPGLGLEIGRFYAIENSRLISYIDFSLGIKILRGSEEFTATLDDPDRSTPYTISGSGIFSQNYATASFNATNGFALSRKMSLHNTIGINCDYRISELYDYDRNSIPMELQITERFIFQAHYKVGVGFSVGDNLMVIPSVETPLITLFEYDDFKSTLAVFNSRYRPLIFRLTIMILDNKPDRKCPKTKKARKSSESLFGMNGSDRPW